MERLVSVVLVFAAIAAVARKARPYRAFAIAVLAILPGACSEGVLAPVGPVGEAQRIILLDSVAIMLAIIIPVILATLAFAWWFRASNSRATYLPNWSYSGRIELIVWSIPALVVLFLGGIAWIGSHDLDPGQPIPSRSKPLAIDVVAFDWKWLFLYPDQKIASLNRLVVPVGVPLHFRITSASVFNVFFVPRFGSMIYAMNGMVTRLNLRADRPGVYHGLSAHFSGDGFSDMHFDAVAVPQAGFERWLDSARRSASRLDREALQGLLRQSKQDTALTYRDVDPGLFDAVATQRLPPGEGPTVGRGGVTVSPLPVR